MLTFSDFFEALGDFDWLGIIVATIVTMIVGFGWYTAFGKQWSAATGIPMSSTPETDKLVKTFVYLLVFNIGVAYLGFLGRDDVESALVFGVIVGLLLISSALYSGVVWARVKSAQWIIDAGHWLVVAAVATFVQGLFD